MELVLVPLVPTCAKKCVYKAVDISKCHNVTKGQEESETLCHQQRVPGGPRCTERGALAQAQMEAVQEVCAVSVQFSTLLSVVKRWKEFVAGRSDAR